MTSFVDGAIALILEGNCHYTCSALRVEARSRGLTYEQASDIANRYYQASTCVVQPYWWNHPDPHTKKRVGNLERHRNELNTMFERFEEQNKAKQKAEAEALAKELES